MFDTCSGVRVSECQLACKAAVAEGWAQRREGERRRRRLAAGLHTRRRKRNPLFALSSVCASPARYEYHHAGLRAVSLLVSPGPAPRFHQQGHGCSKPSSSRTSICPNPRGCPGRCPVQQPWPSSGDMPTLATGRGLTLATFKPPGGLDGVATKEGC